MLDYCHRYGIDNHFPNPILRWVAGCLLRSLRKFQQPILLSFCSTWARENKISRLSTCACIREMREILQENHLFFQLNLFVPNCFYIEVSSKHKHIHSESVILQRQLHSLTQCIPMTRLTIICISIVVVATVVYLWSLRLLKEAWLELGWFAIDIFSNGYVLNHIGRFE